MNETAKAEILRALTDAYGPEKAERLMTQFAASRRDELAWSWLCHAVWGAPHNHTPETALAAAYQTAEAFIRESRKREHP